jgi:hypothetical protein
LGKKIFVFDKTKNVEHNKNFVNVCGTDDDDDDVPCSIVHIFKQDSDPGALQYGVAKRLHVVTPKIFQCQSLSQTYTS